MSTSVHATATTGDLTALAQAAMSRYPATLRGQVRLLLHSENATYEVAGSKRLVMRLHRPHYHTRAEIASELAWLHALNETDILVPRAHAGLDGEWIQSVAYPGLEARYVVLFDWIDGEEPSPDQNLNASFMRLGGITAQLHHHSRHWPRPLWFQRKTWNHHTMLGAQAYWGRWQDAPYLSDADRALLTQVVAQIGARMAAYGQNQERFGLIHADLRLTNLLLQGDSTRIIDFDDCGLSWFMHDLAAALSFFEHHPDAVDWARHWLRGYSRVGQCSRADLDILPDLIMQRRLQLLAWSGTHRGTPQADSLGAVWVAQTAELGRQYLHGTLFQALARGG